MPKRVGSGKNSPRRLTARERDLRCLDLRKMGMSYTDIAVEVGYASPSSAYRAVQKILSDTQREVADELVKLDTERLNMLMLTFWPMAMDPDHPDHFTAAREVRAIMADIRSINGAGEQVLNDGMSIHTGDTIIIQANTEDYIEGLKKMAAALNIVDAQPELTVGSIDEVIEVQEAQQGPKINLRARKSKSNGNTNGDDHQ